jgi:hypothetical protein
MRPVRDGVVGCFFFGFGFDFLILLLLLLQGLYF